MTTVHVLATLATILLPALQGQVTPPQTPRRDAAAAATGTGRISGVVLADETPARPLRRARVMLSTPDLPQGRSVITDDRGRFSFDGLPAARFNLSAIKEAFVTMAFGATRPGRPGTSIALAASEQVSDIVIRLPRGAVITGTVVDQNGQPAAGAGVRAMRWGFMNGQRTLVPGMGGTTDDRGQYRIYGLMPGEYVIMVSNRMAGPMSGGDVRITSEADVSRALRELSGSSDLPQRQDEQRSASYAPVYYPSATSSADASLILVRAGEERSGVDVQLQLVPSVRVEGTVVTRDGQSAPTAMVTLVSTGQQAALPGMMMEGIRTARVSGEGQFSFTAVPAGQYLLTARANPRSAPTSAGTNPLLSASTLYALMPLSVGADGLSNVTLELTEGLVISGGIQFDTSGADTPPPFKGVRVNLTPVLSETEVSLSPAAAQVEADGSFSLTGITPGRYRLIASVPSALASRWMLRSVTAGGRDLADRPFEISAQNIAGVEITFTDRMSQISGAVVGSNGQPALDCYVIVFPADPVMRVAQSRRVQGVRPALDGKFTARIPPGEYLLTALVDVEPGEWQDPGFLERLAAGAVRFTLGDGEQKVQDLRLGGS